MRARLCALRFVRSAGRGERALTPHGRTKGVDTYGFHPSCKSPRFPWRAESDGIFHIPTSECSYKGTGIGQSFRRIKGILRQIAPVSDSGGAAILQRTFSCPLGNSPCAALRLEKSSRVAVRYLSCGTKLTKVTEDERAAVLLFSCIMK